MKRTKIVIGNWKMNLSVPESSVLLEKLKHEIGPKHTEVVVCPGFLDIYSATETLTGSEIGVGSQDSFYEDAGAYTGEVSAHQLKGFVEYAIVGHSERRHIFGETDKIVAKKAAACVAHKIMPIVCVGERLHEKMDGLTNLVVSAQIEASLSELTPKEIEQIIIAYEPVWAIGTGHVCEPKKAQEVIKKIRNLVKVIYGEKAADSVRIIYGGSLNDKNIRGFTKETDIDGFLVGGSSIEHDTFAKMVAIVDGNTEGPKPKLKPKTKTKKSPARKRKAK